MTTRARTRIAVTGIVVSLFYVLFWFVGQEASSDPTLSVPGLVAALYPGTWHPVARGILWLVVGASWVWFDLAVMHPRAQTRAGRAAVIVAAGVTGVCFLVFAIGSFVAAPWSVIH